MTLKNYISIGTASGLGAGLIPFAPGTWGSLVGCLLVFLLNFTGIFNYSLSLIFICLALSIGGYYSIKKLPNSWVHDDPRIVIDEVVGQMLTLAFIPLSGFNVLLGFILFRFFDILKPLGIRRVDNLNSDWGVIVDDLIAGVYANIVLRGLLILL